MGAPRKDRLLPLRRSNSATSSLFAAASRRHWRKKSWLTTPPPARSPRAATRARVAWRGGGECDARLPGPSASRAPAAPPAVAQSYPGSSSHPPRPLTDHSLPPPLGGALPALTERPQQSEGRPGESPCAPHEPDRDPVAPVLGSLECARADDAGDDRSGGEVGGDSAHGSTSTHRHSPRGHECATNTAASANSKTHRNSRSVRITRPSVGARNAAELRFRSAASWRYWGHDAPHHAHRNVPT